MGRPAITWTQEQDDWITQNVGKGFPKAYIEQEFERKFGMHRIYETINRRRKSISGIETAPRSVFTSRPSVSRKKVEARRRDYELRQIERFGISTAEPTELETEMALDWLRHNTPCCASLARDRCRIVSGYRWEFDQIRQLAKENGLKIVKLAADGSW